MHTQQPITSQAITRIGLSIGVILASSFISMLLMHSSTLAIPMIATELKLTAETISWFTLLNILGNALLVLPAGKFTDIYGRRRMLCVGITIAMAACFFSAGANSSLILLVGRFLQGVGGAFIFASALALVSCIPAEQQKAKLMGIYIAVCYLGVVGGPLFGGLVLEYFHWRWVFYIPGFVFLVTAIVGSVFLHWERYGDRNSRVRFLDTCLYMAALIMIALATFRTHELLGQGLFAFGVLSFVVFCWFQSKLQDPLLQVTLFTNNSVFSTLGLSHFFSNCAILALPFTVTLYLQYIKGIDAQTAGFMLIIQGVLTVIFSPLSGWLGARIRVRYLMLFSAILVFVAMLILTATTSATPLWVIVICLALIGLGIGLGDVQIVNASLASVENELLGSASATLNGLRIMGGFVGIGTISYFIGQGIGKQEITPQVYPELIIVLQKFFIFSSVLCFLALLTLCIGVWFRTKSKAMTS